MKPVTFSEFAAFMDQACHWAEPPHLAVAVSGGADSMALALLAHEWATQHGGKITALTIDHRLRAESLDEAKQVTSWMEAHHIPHYIIAWEGEKPTANIQAGARKARYHLLTSWCHANNIRHLLLAHHLDDQAETVLMRLARGSGVDGLCAIPPISEHNNIKIIRPLLIFPKERLEAFLRKQHQPWLTDPSNTNPAFDRPRLREALASIVDYPLLRQRLADTAAHMARARRVLDTQMQQAIEQWVAPHVEKAGVILDITGWRLLEEETALRVLAEITRRVSGEAYRPRFDSLQRLFNEMRSPDFTVTRSFGGCLWTPSRKKNQGHLVTVIPEPK